jgi:hypothetical protein
MLFTKNHPPVGYYVYAYIRKSTGTPYYIGKGKDLRAIAKHGVPVPKDHTKIIILEQNLTEIGALALERRYIAWWGRKDSNTGILYNKTDGGEGGPSRKGSTASLETRKKMSQTRKGRPTWNKGLTKKIDNRLTGGPPKGIPSPKKGKPGKNKGITLKRYTCVHCGKITTGGNIGRYHKHL